MVSTKKKGQKKELLCAKELASEGYFIAFRAFTVKRGPCYVGVDFGDTFDVVAIKPETYSNTPEWLFVSCSYIAHRAEKVASVKTFKEKFNLEPDMRFEVWLWNPQHWSGRNPNKIWCPATWIKEIV